MTLHLPTATILIAVACCSCSKPQRPNPSGPGVREAALTAKVADVPKVETAADNSLLTPEQRSVVIATLANGRTITLGDLEKRLNSEPSVIRQQYATIAKRREYLISWMQLEVLADEARRQGLDKDPEVVESLKPQMVRRYLKEAVFDRVTPESITADEAKQYYDNNLQMYRRPAQVEVRHMLFSDEATAKKVATELRAGAEGSAAKLTAMWQDYVGRVSEDKATVPYLGSLGRVSKTVPEHAAPAEKARLAAIPQEVKEQAFLTEPYTLSSVFKSPAGWHILLPISRLPAVDKPFDDVDRSIRSRLLKRKRDLARSELISSLRTKSKVTINDDAVRLLPVPAPPSQKPRSPAPSAAPPGASGLVVHPEGH